MFRTVRHVVACCTLAFGLADSSPSLATAIIAARSPSRIVLLSDSKVTLSETESGVRCKIRVYGEATFAWSGIVHDLRHGYEPEAIVRRTFLLPGSFRQHVKIAKQLLAQALRREILILKKDDPRMYGWAFRRGETPLQLALAAVEGGVPLLAVLQYKLDWTRDPPGLLVDESSCPGDCKDGSHAYYLGQHDAIDALLAAGVSIAFSDLPELMRREIRDKPEQVGPPVTGVEITPRGRRWIAGEDFCSAE
jgi:hypothetical protein